jgi:pimeloyl-ACP methyl ester carboxylesterase
LGPGFTLFLSFALAGFDGITYSGQPITVSCDTVCSMGMFRSTAVLLCTAMLFTPGCTQDKPLPVVSTSGEHFFDRPWPDDERTLDGHPDMAGFPQREEIDLIERYLTQIEQLDGFGTNAAIYIPLDRRPHWLPSPAETAKKDSPVLLIDIDPNSPERGQLTPVTMRFQEASTNWYRENLLSVQPVWGFPLRPRTTYALVLTKDFVEPDDQTTGDHLLPDLVNTLLQVHIADDDVAFALRFTTQDAVGEMARFEERITHDLSTPALDQALRRFRATDTFEAYEGTMWVPNWQHGTKPYFSSGGGFAFDDDGMPLLGDWEQIHFTLTLPVDKKMPAQGWPVVIYGHGTGGQSRGFATGVSDLLPAHVLARVGIAAFGISLPLHGDRGTGIDPALVSFNYLNPESARACFRQGALDLIYLAETLSTQSHQFDLPNGTTASTNPERLAYMGHSHGGLIGAIAAPFFGERVKGVFLSGAGGGLSSTIVSRDAGDFDIQVILANTLEFSDDDQLVESHPVISAVQTLAEVTDPINYAPYWNARKPFWDTSPMSVLMTEGMHDLQTPPDTAEALATSGHLPLIDPPSHMSLAHRLRGAGVDATPIRKNRSSWSGRSVTGGLAQYGSEDHFAIFYNGNAAALYQTYLYTALFEGTPWIKDL